jgi:hypothetical protein
MRYDAKIDARIASIASRQFGVVAHAQAVDVGATPGMIDRRVRTTRWQRLARSVYLIAGSPDLWMQRAWAAHLEAGPDSVVSHRSAARLLGLPGFAAEGIDVTRPRGVDHRVTLSRLRESSCLPDHHLTVIDGLPCTRIARCIFDLAGDLDPWRSGRAQEVHAQRMMRAFDTSLVRLGNTVERQAAVLAELGRKGRRGTALVRQLVASRLNGHAPVESDLEHLFVIVCATYGLPEPERQVVLGDDTPIGRVDFLFRDARLVVEVDGRSWHDSESDREADRWRENRLIAAGWRVLRIRWRDLVERPEDVARLLRSALALPAVVA